MTAILHLAGEIFQAITLIKIVVAIFMVVTLSMLAERISPRFAGIVAGYPLGAAITLFFCGYEVSPEFASRSAVFTIAGLIATQAFGYFYYLGSLAGRQRSKPWNMAIAAVTGMAGYFAVALLLRPFDFGPVSAAVAALTSIFAFEFLLRNIKNVLILEKAKVSYHLLVMRAVTATIIIILITSAARLIGSRWVGLLAAFPVNIFPLLLIIHFTYQREHAYTIIRNVPRGLGSLVAYSLVVHAVYPVMGIYWGTLTAYLVATLFLVIINSFRN